MSDENERSVASAGSVVDGPLAWCVISDFYYAPVVSADEEAARRLAKGSDKVLALYRSPTLTDAEREAVEAAVGRANRIGTEYAIIDAATLRGLLERIK